MNLNPLLYLVILYSLPYIPPYPNLYSTLYKQRKDLGGTAHKLKPHRLYDPFVISSPELRPIRKLRNSGPPTGLGVAENPLELNGF